MVELHLITGTMIILCDKPTSNIYETDLEKECIWTPLMKEYSQLPLTDTSFKRVPLYSGHVELVPAVLQSFTSSASKADTSLRRTVGAGPERVHLRGS